MKTGNDRHKWEIFWSDELDEAIEKCKHCDLEKRKVYTFKAGGNMRGNTIAQIKVDGNWVNTFSYPCNKKEEKK